MQRCQITAPAVEDHRRRRNIVLVKPGTSVRPREQPIGLVAAGPCCRGKERSHCSSGTRSGEDASEEIPARAEERNEPSLVNGPGIVAGAAIERRLRKRTRATSPRKKRRHIVSVHLQASTQV